MKTIFICLVLGLSLANGETDKALDFTKTNEQFSGKFLSEVVQKNQDKNVIISAYSVLFPLAQLSLASVGDSRKELLTAIGLPENDAGVKKAFQDTTRSLEDVKGVELKIANKIYIKEDAELNEKFAKETKDVFNSEIEKVNFGANKATAKKINSWVESKTNNRIKDLVNSQSLSVDTRVILVNAIYFKGKWKKSFKAAHTKERDFHVTKSKTIQVPMMHKTDYFKYGESDKLNAQLLELPYEGGETSLLVVLPREIDGVNDLVEKLKDTSNLEEALSRMHSNRVDVYLPKFKIETTTDLKEILQNIGIKKLFSSEAQLNNLLKDNTENLKVDSAIQKAFIEVNEEGTEAAAANKFGILAFSSALPVRPPKLFDANRPFVFLLRNNKNTLFSGIIRE